MTDVTDRHLLQARAVSAERLAATGVLARGLAHEINSPRCTWRPLRGTARAGYRAAVTIRGPDPFAVLAQGADRDDPFARAAQRDELTPALHAERSDTLAGHLAERDPNAPAEESAVFQLSGPTSLDDLLRRARLRGFLAGAVVGAALVAGGVAVGSWWTQAPVSAPSPPAAAPQPPLPSLAQPRPAPPEPHVLPLPLDAAPDARPAVPGRAGAGAGAPAPPPAARRRPTAAAHAEGLLVLPALELRAPAPVPAPSAPALPAPSRGLELAEVTAALEARRDAIERCAAEHAADAASAGGRGFHLVLSVAAPGRVSEAALDDGELGATGLGACLVGVAREIRFAPFDGDPVRVELPLRLAGRR